MLFCSNTSLTEYFLICSSRIFPRSTRPSLAAMRQTPTAKAVSWVISLWWTRVKTWLKRTDQLWWTRKCRPVLWNAAALVTRIAKGQTATMCFQAPNFFPATSRFTRHPRTSVCPRWTRPLPSEFCCCLCLLL